MGGGFLIIILIWILVLVHKQAARIKQIETHLNLTEKAREEEERYNG